MMRTPFPRWTILLGINLAIPLAAGPVSAKTECVPSAMLSTSPHDVKLVATNDGADPIGSITFVVRDAAANPYPGSVVWMDFSGCSDLRIAPDPSQPISVNCSTKSLYATTGADGSVTFRIAGGVIQGAMQSLPDCARVYADGVQLKSPIVSALDLDGRNGVNATDLSIAYADVISGQYRPRVDYDADGDSDLLDLCFLYKALLARGSTSSAPACP